MDKLEQYLEQVCRSIGGPRSLRQHVRQELREHLRDAAAEHQSAGLSGEEALDKAIADFGGPEEVRSELEATHGHRLLPVVIDKAMQWKEMTMRAKWLWMTWTYVAVIGIVVLEVLHLSFCAIYLVPKLKKIRLDGWLAEDAYSQSTLDWLYSFLDRVYAGVMHIHWIALGLAAVWGLFEWRVRSENKTFMRLSALGTIGVALLVVVMLTTAGLVLPFQLGLPGSKIARPWALEAVASIDKSVTALEEAMAKKDWQAMQEHASQASRGLGRLEAGPSLHALTNWNEPPTVLDLREQLKSAKERMAEVDAAIQKKDVTELEAALAKFRKAYEPLREAAKRPGK